MAWNEPGPGRDPWNSPPGGKRGGNQGPPDLEALLRKLTNWLRGSRPAGRAQLPRGAGALIAAGLALLWLVSGFYSVDEQERAVVLRFGAYAGASGPGVQWHLPWPIERVEKVNVTGVRSVTNRATMLTQDQNVVDVELTVQYRVSAVEDYLFNVTRPDDTLQEALKTALRQVVGRSTMDSVLTDGRDRVAGETRAMLQERLDQYRTGLTVTEVNLQQAQPPEAVQGAFADAIKAHEDQQRLQSEAEAYANDRLPRARGDAARRLSEAAAYREQVVSRAQGEAARFSLILEEYRHSPQVTRERLYLDTISDILARSNKVLVDVDKGNPVFYVPLPQAAKPEARTGTDVLPPAADAAVPLRPQSEQPGSDAPRSHDRSAH